MLFDDRDHLSVGARLRDAELMGSRVAVIVGNQFDKSERIDLRLLHKELIGDVWRKEESEGVGKIHSVLREKVRQFDMERLQQLGYDITRQEGRSME